MRYRLRDIADFRTGYQFRGRVQPEPRGNARVIQIKDVEAHGKISIADLTSVNVDRPQPYLVQRDDVLFLSRGFRLYAVIVPEVGKNTIATGYFFIIRPRPDLIVPEYLAWAMNEPDFQESLRPYVPSLNRVLVPYQSIFCIFLF